MTDFLGATPQIARSYCPGCEPEADPTKEILDPRWCAIHTPSLSGVDDGKVTTEAILSGSAEAGGADNRRWCEVVHRDPLEELRRSERTRRSEEIRRAKLREKRRKRRIAKRARNKKR